MKITLVPLPFYLANLHNVFWFFASVSSATGRMSEEMAAPANNSYSSTSEEVRWTSSSSPKHISAANESVRARNQEKRIRLLWG